MMRSLMISILALALSAGTAQAISRYESTKLSCARIHGIINAQGAAIMRYPSTRVPGLVLYDRYVRNGTLCMVGEAATLRYIPAADTKRCPVYACASFDLEDNFPFSRGHFR
jgi:hypothetical protein